MHGRPVAGAGAVEAVFAIRRGDDLDGSRRRLGFTEAYL